MTSKNVTVSVRNDGDILRWLNEVHELRMITDPKVIFVPFHPENDALVYWTSILDGINRARPADGMIVYCPVDTLVEAATAVAFATSSLRIPILFVGYPSELAEGSSRMSAKRYRALGIRSNLVNAAYMTTVHPMGTSIVWGNAVVPATRSRLVYRGDQPFVESVGRPVARIDFGVTLLTRSQAQAGSSEELQDTFVPIAIVREHPGMLSVESIPEDPNVAALFVSVTLPIRKDRMITYAAHAKAHAIPLVVYTPRPVPKSALPKNCIPVDRVTESTAMVKTMWALGNGTLRTLPALLQKPIADERMTDES